jgi:hypothetical protein
MQLYYENNERDFDGSNLNIESKIQTEESINSFRVLSL